MEWIKSKGQLIALIAMLFTMLSLATGCPAVLPLAPSPFLSTSPSPSPIPSVIITYPAPGAYEIVNNVIITVSVSNFNLVDKIGQANAPGEGHLVYYLDVQPPTTPGKPALTAPGTYAVSTDTSYLWSSAFIGAHTLSVQLVNNDNTPLSLPVTASIKMMVNS